MSFWSKVKDAYKSVDKALGGYLPGGVSPGSTSSGSSSSGSTSSGSTSSSTSSTTSSSSGRSSGGSSGGSSSGSTTKTFTNSDGSTGTITTTTIEPETKGIIVTDYTSGESVKTEFKNGRITSQTYSGGGGGGSSGGSSSSNLLGEQKSLELANREGGLVSQTSQSYNKPASQNQGNTLQPGQLTISAANYNPNEPPQRYNRPLGSAIGESFKNIFNFGVIGQQGIGAYAKQAFFEPFEYVGKPKAYSTAPNLALQNWQGTEFGYGLPESEKNKYRPEQFQTKTYYQIGEKQKAELFVKAGVINNPFQYTGEPTAVLPTRIGEKVVSDLRPKYQDQLNQSTTELYNFYQGKVTSGELTQSQAQTQFEAAVKQREKSINTAFQTEAQGIYSSRVSSVSKDITSINKFQADIFEPPAYPVIRTTGKVIETGAIIGATAFGGSGITLAASGYLGVKTAYQANQYAASFDQLTTGQKVLGGVGLAAGAVATAYTFNLGVNKFYSEWRGIIYNDLARSPARVTGQEVLKTGELTRYNIASLRTQGTSKALTVQKVDVYQTGTNRIGFYGKGVTRTTIYDPQYEKFVTTSTKFTTSGYVPNIKEGVTFGSQGIKLTPEGYYGGLGSSIYSSDKTLKSFNFISASKSESSFYRVAGAVNPQRSFSGSSGGINYVSTAVKGRFDSAGTIYKLPAAADSAGTVIIGSGKKSSQAFFNQLYGVRGAASVQATKQAQVIGLNEVTKAAGTISTSQTATTTAAVSAYAGTGLYERTQEYAVAPQIQAPQRQNSLVIAQLPQLQQILPQSQTQRQGVGVAQTYGFSAASIGQNIGQVPAILPALATGTGLKLGQGLKLRTGNVLAPNIPQVPGYFSPTPPISEGGFIPPFYFNLNPGGLALPSNIVKGGQRRTAYTPSFSALVFNIKGSYSPNVALSKSGIDFRPITKGFSFATGLGSINFRRILKRR